MTHFVDKLRRYWHDLYYFFAGPRAKEYALRCRHVVDQINLGPDPKFQSRFRLRLHLSLCQACANYYGLHRALRRAIRNLTGPDGEAERLLRMKDELLRRYGKES